MLKISHHISFLLFFLLCAWFYLEDISNKYKDLFQVEQDHRTALIISAVRSYVAPILNRYSLLRRLNAESLSTIKDDLEGYREDLGLCNLTVMDYLGNYLIKDKDLNYLGFDLKDYSKVTYINGKTVSSFLVSIKDRGTVIGYIHGEVEITKFLEGFSKVLEEKKFSNFVVLFMVFAISLFYILKVSLETRRVIYMANSINTCFLRLDNRLRIIHFSRGFEDHFDGVKKGESIKVFIKDKVSIGEFFNSRGKELRKIMEVYLTKGEIEKVKITLSRYRDLFTGGFLMAIEFKGDFE